MAKKLDLTIKAEGTFYDLIIVGGGPAGLMSVIYTAREDTSTLVIDRATLEISVPGVFAAGDARLGSTKQVAAAVGEGATAALMVRHYLDTHRSR